MKPFDAYHEGGFTILPRRMGGKARREYGH